MFRSLRVLNRCTAHQRFPRSFAKAVAAKDASADAALLPEGELVTTDERLQYICDKARAHGTMALDTEFHLEKTYFIHLALVQVAVDREVFCIDPFEVDTRPLEDVIADGSVCKLLHAAGMDAKCFHQRSGQAPKNVFDTQIGGGMLGHGNSAYGELVEHYAGTKLSKGATMSDWLKRPLLPAQIRYAEDDVRYLEEVTMMLLRAAARAAAARAAAAGADALLSLSRWARSCRRS